MLTSTRRRVILLTRTVVIVLLGIGFGAALGSEAHPHAAGTYKSGGTWVHYSSFRCINDIGGVPNPDTHTFIFRCTATATRILVLCYNPQNHDVRPGEAATKTTIVVQDPITDADLIGEKKKGLAHKELSFEDADFVTSEVCVNPNWIPIRVLVTELVGEMDVLECTGRDANPCSTLVLIYTEKKACMLPSQYNIDNPPPEGTDTPYNCVLIFRDHVK